MNDDERKADQSARDRGLALGRVSDRAIDNGECGQIVSVGEGESTQSWICHERRGSCSHGRERR